MSTVLDVGDVSYTYTPGAPPAVDQVAFNLGRGEIVGLIGPNGSGKSTLIKNIVDLLQLQSGTIDVSGSPHDTIPARSQIIFLASNDYLPEFLTAWEYLRLIGRLYNVAIDRDDAEAQFERYSMVGRLDHLMEDFSHGMRKKTQLVAAFLVNRQITIVDETLNGIDLEALHLWEQEARARRESGNTILLCTHDFALLERIADRVIFLDLGEIVAAGPTADLLNEHGSLAALVFNYIDGGRT